jgi:RNA polymerase sigma-70 factor (ECF subfamily)
LNGPAAARLYDEHVDAIYAYVARRVGPAAAITVVEDVFEQALRQQATRPATANSDLGWLLAIATAFLRRHSETERTRLLDWSSQPGHGSAATPTVTDPLLSNDGENLRASLTAKVMAAVAELEPAERDLLFLVAWEGCSSSLAATATGLPQGEIRTRLSAVRKELRNRVAAAVERDVESAVESDVESGVGSGVDGVLESDIDAGVRDGGDSGADTAESS